MLIECLIRNPVSPFANLKLNFNPNDPKRYDGAGGARWNRC
jgi:hypothetical protein